MLFRLFSLFVFALVLCGCSSGLTQVSEVVGLSDPAPPSAITVDVLCDHSSAACQEGRLRLELLWGLDGIVDRPGSNLREFALGDDLASTKLLAEVTVTPSPNPSTSAVRAHQASFRTTALEHLMAAAGPLWKRAHRSSPIVETLGGVALYPAAKERIIVILSDLRQESAAFGNFECGALPSTPSWNARTKSLFAPLRGSQVFAAYVTPFEPVGQARCSSTNDRHTRLLDLWNSSLTSSGAKVVISADAINQPLSSFLGGAQ
jgi:hypothetical protein